MIWSALGAGLRGAAGAGAGAGARGAASAGLRAAGGSALRTAGGIAANTAYRGVVRGVGNSGGHPGGMPVASQQFHSFTGLSENARSTNEIDHQTAPKPQGVEGLMGGRSQEDRPLGSVLDTDGFSGSPKTGLSNPGPTGHSVPLPGKDTTMNSGRRMTEFMPTSSADPISKYNIGTGVNWGAGGSPMAAEFKPGASGKPTGGG